MLTHQALQRGARVASDTRVGVRGEPLECLPREPGVARDPDATAPRDRPRAVSINLKSDQDATKPRIAAANEYIGRNTNPIAAVDEVEPRIATIVQTLRATVSTAEPMRLRPTTLAKHSARRA
jgi:hypothetical protein